MAYLEVFLQEGSTGPIAISATGISLAREMVVFPFLQEDSTQWQKIMYEVLNMRVGAYTIT